MRDRRRATRDGFSLLEVVIVVAIIAILAAIGIPRMSRGSRGANDSALSGNLAVLRNAIDLYAAEHGGSFPALATFEAQMTQYTDVSGTSSLAREAPYIYGPYIRAIPTLPVGTRKGQKGVADADAPTVGWIYDATKGTIKANGLLGDADEAGKAYDTY
jgi:prepilin-type N-terminal cleavage/methylation domain-containing protein